MFPIGPLVIPLIEAGVSLAGQLWQSIHNKNQAKKQREHQKQIAEYSYTKDLEMWNKQNEYNSTSAQMQRLKDAGLNPNLVYGSGNVTGNVAGQIPKYQQFNPEYAQVGFPMPSVLDKLGRYQDVQMKGAQTNNLGVQNDIMSAELALKNLQLQKNKALLQADILQGLATAKTAWQKSVYQDLLNNMTALNYKFNQDTYGSRVANTLYQSQLSAQQIGLREKYFGLSQEKVNQAWQNLKVIQQKLPYQIQEMEGNILLKGLTGKEKNQAIKQWEDYKGTKNDPWWMRGIYSGYEWLNKKFDSKPKYGNGFSGYGGSW